MKEAMTRIFQVGGSVVGGSSSVGVSWLFGVLRGRGRGKGDIVGSFDCQGRGGDELFWLGFFYGEWIS